MPFTVTCPGCPSASRSSKAAALKLAQKYANETGKQARVTPTRKNPGVRQSDRGLWATSFPPEVARFQWKAAASAFAKKHGWLAKDAIYAETNIDNYYVVGQSIGPDTMRLLTRDGGYVDVPFPGYGKTPKPRSNPRSEQEPCRDREGNFIPTPFCRPQPTEPPTRHEFDGVMYYRKAMFTTQAEAKAAVLAYRKQGYKSRGLTFATPTGDIIFGVYTRGRATIPASKLTKRNPRSPMTIQTLLFSRDSFQPSQAKAWAKRNGYRSTSIDVTENTIRMRQRDPGGFDQASFRTFPLTDGVQAVGGRLKRKMKRA